MLASHPPTTLIVTFRETEADVLVARCPAEEMAADQVREERGETAHLLLDAERRLPETVDRRRHKRNSMLKWKITLETEPRRMIMVLATKPRLKPPSLLNLRAILRWLSRCVLYTSAGKFE